ncbi:putative transcription factor C3H family [Rosa chinensis]|uniref:Putative transcription factor C3H family n=1 Tax=Rosa chinensis TaxID=74649 RepID=A0A2P6PQT9_ROSCH|nr:zinc finger CCCH domain-containing protein 48 [Rosa chinensis]XP_024167275.1 zinc finger CCCH domain-containing protein 48 [Rosa chinensis]PRQ24290.1 putative transcription factor C3H family [Rosa chinensis]
MAFKAVKRPANRSDISVYSRPGPGGGAVCKFFQQGKCTRIECRFSHVVAPTPLTNPRALVWTKEETITRRDKNIESIVTQQTVATPKRMPGLQSMATQKSIVTQKSMPSQQSLANKQSIATQKSIVTQQSIPTQKSIATQKNNAILKPLEKVCNFWANGKCMKGDRCPYLHSWFCGDGFSMLAKLQDHKKTVTGIVLPEGSSKLYSASKDGTVRIWDCHTGHCGSVINLGCEAGCLFSKGPWVFAGAPNVVEAWNIQTNAAFSLSAPAAQVHAMEVGNEMLFAGTQEGVILVWKDGPEDNPFQLAAPLEGHTGAVVCLKVEADRLYSGSVDHTIRAWDLNTLQSIMTLNAHSDVVTSLIYWGQFLISCSLDCTIKVWAEKGNLEATYTHTQEHGLLGLSGVADAEAKPVLLCSCKDNSVRLYELPSFAERGRLFAKEEVGAIQVGPGGLFFSGDGTGLLSVWKWVEPGLKVESS